METIKISYNELINLLEAYYKKLYNDEIKIHIDKQSKEFKKIIKNRVIKNTYGEFKVDEEIDNIELLTVLNNILEENNLIVSSINPNFEIHGDQRDSWEEIDSFSLIVEKIKQKTKVKE